MSPRKPTRRDGGRSGSRPSNSKQPARRGASGRDGGSHRRGTGSPSSASGSPHQVRGTTSTRHGSARTEAARTGLPSRRGATTRTASSRGITARAAGNHGQVGRGGTNVGRGGTSRTDGPSITRAGSPRRGMPPVAPPTPSDPSDSRRRINKARRDAQAKRREASGKKERRKPPKEKIMTASAIVVVAAALVASIAYYVTHPTNSASPTESYAEPKVEIVNHAPNAVDTSVGDASLARDNSVFDWSRLDSSDPNHYAYKLDGTTVSKLGVDVSEHQEEIDWEKVRADGVSFAYLRLGYRGTVAGNIVVDSLFRKNLRDAKAAGLKVGAYFYSQATTAAEAEEEADFVLKRLDGSELDYPVAFDLEPSDVMAGRSSQMDAQELAQVALAFCKRIEQGGYTAIVYGNQVDLGYYDLEELASYGYWYAEYGSTPSMRLRFALWQYSNAGTIDGIDGPVDVDLDLTSLLHDGAEG
ncbi:glycoside hydrolase family 25 protein [uncultured Olsenella sp.]|uniref:glycoside hydrolase family 25 protein n=1 Tax=uncultured Olsenella sp. TaxID=190764 RepID=UPI0026DBE290|nr:GH25 family lysozyme [uncultured Olsenella sp.]